MTTHSRRSSASHKHWKLNWWDLWPLVDGERRPLQWTSDSLILSAHPTVPAVIARVFPSSLSFMLPSPGSILSNPTAYFPPRIIEVSSDNQYIFAYFESKIGHNIACIWSRGETIDDWKIDIDWAPEQGQGFVAARWLAERRTWSPKTPPVRTPAIGPRIPLCKPPLLIVTQSHTVQVVHQLTGQLETVSASLRGVPGASCVERSPQISMMNGSGGLNVCVKAAIGLGYNESSILIATSSTVIPPSSITNSEIPGHLGAMTSTSVSLPPTPWENFGVEHTINLCEVKITFNSFIVAINTIPLPPLYPQVALSANLTDIIIIPHLSTETPGPADDMRVESCGNWMEMVLAYLDVEDYISPKSTLISFELKRGGLASHDASNRSAWTHHYLYSRSFTETAVSFLAPSRRPGSAAMFIGLLDMGGYVPRQFTGDKKITEIRMGKISRLNLPQFEDDNSWLSSSLMVGIDDVGTNPPLSAALSPNEVLICTSPSMWTSQSKVGVHILPRFKAPGSEYSSSCKRTKDPTSNNTVDSLLPETLSELLHATLLCNHSPADLVHVISNPAFPLSSVIRVLELTCQAFDQFIPIIYDWHSSMLRVLADICRSRSKHISSTEPTEKEKQEKERLDQACTMAHDHCSVKAVRSAFEAFEEDDGFDMEPVWHLTSLTTWLLDFSEKIVRACVLWEGSSAVHDAPPRVPDQAPLVKVETTDVEAGLNLLDDNNIADYLAPNVPPILINIVHPYMLDNLIMAVFYVNTFRAFLETLTASKLKAGIAKDIFRDVIDGSAINLERFEAELRKIQQLKEFTSLDANLLRKCFCFMFPLPPTHKLLAKACKLLISPDVVSKARLFIKPIDLIDGVSSLSLTAPKASQERDIVSKGILAMPSKIRTCIRCGGQTATGQSRFLSGRETTDYNSWVVWEREWDRCICGGSWIKGPNR